MPSKIVRLKRWLRALRCAWNGHQTRTIIEQYSREAVRKTFLNGKIRPHTEIRAHGKWCCLECGHVGVGEVVAIQLIPMRRNSR